MLSLSWMGIIAIGCMLYAYAIQVIVIDEKKKWNKFYAGKK